VQHVTDDSLELYAMQALPQSDAIPMEEHLRICPDCRERLQAEIEFVAAMRGAAVTIRKIEKS
jgi:predicted anti-sigma-YlaC factor YlaD